MRVLVLVPGTLDDRMTGPEMRAWELARALAAEHDVTAVVQARVDGVRDGVRLVSWSRRQILREAAASDAVLSHCLPPYLLALKARRPLIAISDQYDPIELELATLADKRYARRELRSAAAIRALQLRFADIVLCAGESQRTALTRELAALGRDRDPVVVPFGIAPAPPATQRHPLRERFGFTAHETVVLWWGSVWRWFDAPTAVRAVGLAAARRPDLRLIITAGRPPRAELDRFAATEDARAVAAELGLLDRVVHFVDEWIGFDERHEWLADADVGLTLHRDTPEAPLAARARYMDYLWAGLPCVLGRGDDVADRFGASGFASLVGGGEPAAVADALLALAEPQALADARAAGRALAEATRWPAVTASLLTALRRRQPAAVGRAGLLAGAGAYYARQAADRVWT
jgi:glycosyltransferase involved in cell wall biosynthesis